MKKNCILFNFHIGGRIVKLIVLSKISMFYEWSKCLNYIINYIWFSFFSLLLIVIIICWFRLRCDLRFYLYNLFIIIFIIIIIIIIVIIIIINIIFNFFNNFFMDFMVSRVVMMIIIVISSFRNLLFKISMSMF